MIWQLSEDPHLFPDPHYGEADGLIAVGGDLSPERLAVAYMNGIFPWYGFKEREQILWWCPMQRFVIFPKEIHISHSMKQMMRKKNYHVTVNEDFDRVIKECSNVNGRFGQEGAWLGNDMIKAYTEMHKLGLAVSVEVWDTRQGDDYSPDKKLIGGLYGINIDKNFFGESMFSLAPNGSKLALIYLAKLMEPFGGIIDCQFETAHLKSMGGRHISYEEYMKYLQTEEQDS